MVEQQLAHCLDCTRNYKYCGVIKSRGRLLCGQYLTWRELVCLLEFVCLLVWVSAGSGTLFPLILRVPAFA